MKTLNTVPFENLEEGDEVALNTGTTGIISGVYPQISNSVRIEWRRDGKPHGETLLYHPDGKNIVYIGKKQ